jgi:REP element-mobilizing transposase RayT
MSHTKSKILIHMVFATFERNPTIVGDFKPDLYAYMAGTVRGLGAFLHALGGVEDHCHLVFDLPPKLALADFANQLKSGTSRWARSNGHRQFSWQRGYGAFSVNQSSLERAVQYVESQEAHHRKQTFRDELAEFLRVHGMEADAEFIDGVYSPDPAA